MSDRARLQALAAAARPLEPDHAERAALMAAVQAHAERYLDALPDAPTYRVGPVAAPGFPDAPAGIEEALAFISDQIEQRGIATASGRFMGYIPGGGLFHSALGDFLADVSNKYAGFASAAPGAVRLENACVRWLADAIGYPAEAAGALTSGGSIANLSAIVAARDALDQDGGGAVYVAPTAHHCVDKALKIAGRGAAPRRTLALDANHRIALESLEAALEQDRRDGVRPWLVVASAGTVDTGSVDPLTGIAELCARYGAWMHVDGAYGGLFMLCPEGRAVLGGIERADTLAVDPHKTLFLPYGTGAVLARDGRTLRASFSAAADYLTPFAALEDISPADLSPELTRHFRALRLWLPIQLAGLDAFRAAQSEKIGLARYMHARLSELPGWETGAAPDLSVFAFRYRPGKGDIDAFNERLTKRIQDDGRVFLSSTRIYGRLHLRAAILSFRAHLEHVDEAIDALQSAARALEAE
ncbi:putative aromatic L-amino acid decarboxylase [Sphingomonas changbaiensis NBRC 104936]|uniref:Putative aromatic L-amino acid decarboxylase n=1 Tax=Sphingomonas changbaiensis NBRC 104936 TaxID=1219043 RepID=A0A0E9MP64_9SPHN|nr:aminotransferase class I/II-fold pyridoxal phosphate-dependent enzyme [Sphingomonas changbaiensis]GAO39552.1 putative aromatic L-amino acid decarboxylase [Sphingomonas changbaiensis NBRC 104936]